MDSETSLLDVLPGLIWTARPDGMVDFVNQGWCDYTGASAGCALGHGWHAMVHPDDLPPLLAALQQIRASGRPVPLEARMRRFDEQWNRFAWRIRAQCHPDGTLLRWVGILIDIEDIVSTAPPDGDIDFRPLIDSIPGSVSVMAGDGTVEYVNVAGRAYRGATISQLRLWKTSGSIHPDDVPPAAVMWERCLRTGEPFDREHRIRRSDGVYRWFRVHGMPVRNAEGRVIRWCFLDTDIDDIRASEARLRAIIDAGPGLVWSAGPDGAVEFLNQRWYEYTGMTPDEARGHGWTRAVHPDDGADLAVYWIDLLEAGLPGQYEARLRRHDGTYRWFLIKAVPQCDDEGRVVRWYGANTDIDDRKQAEEALHKVRSELTHVARVATLGALTASIAHEVNQPLAGIITNANTCLRMLGADPPNVEGALETARRTIRDGYRASDVIKRLRALFSKKALISESVDINDAAREVVALLLGELQRHGVVLYPDYAADLPPVNGDRVQLQQVMLNLLLNASDAMREVADRPRHVRLRTWNDHGYVHVAVQDNGVGFDPADAERLFNAFFTTKDAGMGIGLSVSQSIIESLGGVLHASLNHDHGATFAFHLPRA